MRMSVKTLLAAALVMTAGTFCYGADQIDNPQYKAWAKFKAGTTVTMKTESDMAGNKTEMETTTTLLEINADKAVVETKMSMTMAGTKTDIPASKQEVLAKMDKPPEVAPDPNAPKPEVKESTEDVDAAGKKVKAKVTETKNTANGMTTVSKVWMNDEIPGGMIKMETTMDGAVKGTTKMTLTSMTIK